MCLRLKVACEGSKGEKLWTIFNWELQDTVESARQLRLRNELIAIRTLRDIVGAGQSKVLVTLSFPAIRPSLDVAHSARTCDFLDFCQNRWRICGDRETPDPPLLASRILLGGKNATVQD